MVGGFFADAAFRSAEAWAGVLREEALEVEGRFCNDMGPSCVGVACGSRWWVSALRAISVCGLLGAPLSIPLSFA